ncbi:MAG: hypothetical protein KBA26_14965, partial [Candidatus Delongbacteria bacterium]|nr:hypothetical protein [Candidatus Delongbacteria bacterium]
MMKGFTQLRRLPIKYRIIIPFSLITLLLVLGMSRGYYHITRNAYLRHLNDQIRSTLELIAAGFDYHYLEYLSDGGDQNHPAFRYYREKFNRQSQQVRRREGEMVFKDRHFVVAIGKTQLQRRLQAREN